jgi:hypothetical protein
MITGLNQNVEVLGRTFHVQTEVTSGDDAKVRTTVFVGGRIVGARESAVDPAECSEDQVREQMNSQHGTIIDNLVKRAVELQAERQKLGMPSTPPEATTQPQKLPTKEVPLPRVDAQPRLPSSIQVRQLIGPFSLAFEPTPPSNPVVLRTCLETAARQIDEVMASEIFPGIRLDEQVRFFDLRERLAAWRGGGREPAEGAEIWAEIVVFATHLRKISDRRELVAYDHQLITWALLEVGRNGVRDEAVSHLRNLYGRDPDLDRLLDHPELAAKEALLEVLINLLDRTLPA